MHGADNAAVGAVFCAAVVISLLAHEFGHVFAVRWFLGSESTVILWGLGGLCVHEPTRVARKQVGISLMGPAFGLAMGLLCLALHLALPPMPTLVTQFLAAMVWIGFVWTALNLLPILPLDGGQALQAALSTRLGPAAGRVTARISVITAVGVAVFAFTSGYQLGAVLCLVLIAQNLTRAGRGL